MGIPMAFGTMAYMFTSVPFSPFQPIMGLDPMIIMGAGTIGASIAGYFGGASLGQVLWRLRYHALSRNMDVMDRLFYAKVKAYRAERGQSPYVNTLAGTGRMLTRLTKGSVKGGEEANAQRWRMDFYGEKVKSVGEYRQWLRRQIQMRREQGDESALVRGVKVFAEEHGHQVNK
jgi:import inner membrane translocase subunit TIM23